MLKFALLFIPCLAMAAVPTIQDVSDAASYGPRVAPGSLASLFGADLASGTGTATVFPLPTNLSGTTVSVAGTLAPLLYVSPTQINFQVPAATGAGPVKVVVNGPGGASAEYTVSVTAAAPSIFQYGANHALAQNADGQLNSATAPAAAGSYITVYLTGQGAVDNAVPDGEAAPDSPLSTASATATATIGPQTATVAFFGITPEFAGLAQANIQVPALPPGDYPLVITAGGFIGASAIVSVSGSGSAYTSPLALVSSVAFSNPNPGSVVLYGGVAYVCGSNRIVMVDVSAVNGPSVIGEFGDGVLNGNGNRCFVSPSSQTPFLVDIVGSDAGGVQSLAVYSLADPSAPAFLANAATSYSHIEDLSFVGVYGVATTSYITYYTNTAQIASQQGDFIVFSFLDPSHPLLVTSLPASAPAGSGSQFLKPWADIVAGNYVYVASTTASGASTSGSGTLDVIDVTIPSSPDPLNQLSIPQAAIALSFDVTGNTLLVAGSTAGQRNPGIPDFDFTGYLTLTAVDITNPIQPAAVSTVTTKLQVNGTFFTRAFSNGVFAIVNKPPAADNFGPSSLMVVDARNPSALALYPFQTQFGFSGILTTGNGYLLAPTTTGLNIYQLRL